MLTAADFYNDHYRWCFSACSVIAQRGDPITLPTLAHELDRVGRLDEVGGEPALVELVGRHFTAIGVEAHARLVSDTALQRRLIRAGSEVVRLAYQGGADPAQLIDAAQELIRTVEAPGTSLMRRSDRLVNGADFVLDLEADTALIWGDLEHQLWKPGGALMLIGPEGVGKTTLAQQLALALAGIKESLLGYPVAVTPGRVLYIAADRPRQAARSLARMVTEADRSLLESKLAVWQGPPPIDVVADPRSLVRFIQQFDDITVAFIDSLKDIVIGLSDDKVGAAYNVARQHVLAEGIELVELHHQRKEQRGSGNG